MSLLKSIKKDKNARKVFGKRELKINNTNLKESTLFRKRIAGRVNQRTDIQVYDLLPDKIKKEIDKKGRTIHV